MNLFDRNLWNRAGWVGVAYLVDVAPLAQLCLVFRDRNAAVRIFDGWHRALTEMDHHDAIRVVVVEGRVPGEPPGHSVGLGAGKVRLWVRLPHDGAHAPLEDFKTASARDRCFVLLPAVLLGDGHVTTSRRHALGKHRVEFRRAEDIGPGDRDASVFNVPALRTAQLS
jgi:hypothetical protein